jgi:putative nucleotidyltransferase with HDIG domain
MDLEGRNDELATCLKRLEQVKDLPTVPPVLMKINEMLGDQGASIDSLGRLIETDPAIASKVLRLVNSAFYGFRSEISSIAHAVMILGFNTVRNAAISVAVVDAFRVRHHFTGFDLNGFWRHSIAVAVTGRHLARGGRFADPDNAFSAGLLHDVGKLVMLQYLPDWFERIWSAMQDLNVGFHEAEKRVMPAGHAEIGAFLAGRWQFPLCLGEAIRLHHEPRAVTAEPNLIRVVHLANAAVHGGGNGTFRSAVDALPQEWRAFHESRFVDAQNWFPDLAPEIEAACRFFLEGQG